MLIKQQHSKIDKASCVAYPGLICLGLCFVACNEKASIIKHSYKSSFDGNTLEDSWSFVSGDWSIKQGVLHSSKAHNNPVWLNRTLPKNLELTFTAWSSSPSVDLKFEIFGDGKHHQSGYVIILAGWNNSISIIARYDEHGRERTPALTKQLIDEYKTSPALAVKKYKQNKERISKRVRMLPHKKYDLKFVRINNWLRFYVDGIEHLSYFDPSPLYGDKNNRFAFNNWASEVYYDDLVITPL